MSSRHSMFALSVCLGFALAVAPLAAEAATNVCVKNARSEHGECKQACSTARADATDACRLQDPVCVDACLAGREECRSASGIGSDLDLCAAEREAAAQACRAQFAAGSPERDSCIDAAQLQSFLCRYDSRKANQAELRVCQAGFRGCRGACPRNANPPESPSACRAAAKDAFASCKLDCQEDFQVEKDICLNRDHACVELCRADRALCMQGADDALGTRIASCNADRNAQVTACNGDEACIQAAKATAFQCRDQAREDLKPQFQACRAAFHACVEGPPGCGIVPAP